MEIKDSFELNKTKERGREADKRNGKEGEGRIGSGYRQEILGYDLWATKARVVVDMFAGLRDMMNCVYMLTFW